MVETSLMNVTEKNLDQVMERELLQEVMDNIDFQPGRIKIMHREKQFLLPDGKATKEIKGVVIYFHRARGFWRDEGESMPTCSSMDGKKGTVTETGEPQTCSSCPYNQFGSDLKGGKGKACKEMRRLFVLQEGDMYPSILSIPPTSLRNWDSYVSNLVSKKKIPLAFVTTFTLEKANTGSFDYSKIVPEIGEQLDKQTILNLLKMREEVVKAAEKIGIEGEDYGTTDSDIIGEIVDDKENPFA